MNNNNHIKILYSVIWLLILALSYCIYYHSDSYQKMQNWSRLRWDWTLRQFWNWSGSTKWNGIWTWINNNFSPDQKLIIDELKKVRESWDKEKERELINKLRSNINNSNK